MKLADGLGEFYSRFKSRNSFIEVFIDSKGYPTTTYPHVHAVYRPEAVDIVASVRQDCHLWRTTLSGYSSGQEVQAAIEQATRYITEKRGRLVRTSNGQKTEAGEYSFYGADGNYWCDWITVDNRLCYRLDLFKGEDDSDPYISLLAGDRFSGQPGGLYWRESNVWYDDYDDYDDYDEEEDDQ